MATQPEPRSEPRPPLNRERVLRAAMRLADHGGIESLSMRKLGQELGVEAMSLYAHVANKDDILDGIVDLVVSEIDVPADAANWRAAMRLRAISAHQALVRHPWACNLIGSRMNVGPAMMKYVDLTLGWLRVGGFSVTMTLDAWHALDSHIYGYTIQQLTLPFSMEETAQMAAMFLPQIPADKYPHFHEVVAAIGVTGRIETFEFGLDLILDGLERTKDGP